MPTKITPMRLDDSDRQLLDAVKSELSARLNIDLSITETVRQSLFMVAKTLKIDPKKISKKTGKIV